MTASLAHDGFGARLRETRKRLGMSQTELGGDRYTGSYISHLESGRRAASRGRHRVPGACAWASRRRVGHGAVACRRAGATASTTPMRSSICWSPSGPGQTATGRPPASSRPGRPRRALQRRCSPTGIGRRSTCWLRRSSPRASSPMRSTSPSNSPSTRSAASSPSLRAQALCLSATAHRVGDELPMALVHAGQAVEAGRGRPADHAGRRPDVPDQRRAGGWPPTAETDRLCRRLEDVSLHVESDHARGVIDWALGTACVQVGRCRQGAGAPRAGDGAARSRAVTCACGCG